MNLDPSRRPGAGETPIDLAQRLGISPQFSVHATDDNRVMLLSEQRSFRLNGKLYVALMPHLDGTLTGEQVVQAFAGRVARERLRSVLQDMLKKNYVSYYDTAAPKSRQALWAELGREPADAERRLAGRSIAVTIVAGAGAADESTQQAAEMLHRFAQEAGIQVAAEEKAAITVVVVDDYLRRDLGAMNQRMRREGRSWLMFKPGGSMPLFGPLFRPQGATCWACLARHMLESRPGDRVVSGTVEAARPASAHTGATLALATSFAALELARALAEEQPSDLERHVLSFDLKDRAFERHMVRSAPACPVCGHPENPDVVLERASQPVVLRAQPVLGEVDGGWRTKTADDVVRNLQRYVSPITGIISGLEDKSPAKGLPVFGARQTNPVHVGPRQNRLVGRPYGAAGKGMTEIQAKASCLGEAVERYLCGYTGNEPRRRATWDQVRSEAPHPYSYLNYSERQYDTRESWNESNDGFNWVGERYDESRPIEWTPAWSLSRNRLRWLPTRFCYFSYVDPVDEDGKENAFCRSDSNGCASGSTLEEAIVQGFFELIERDACALWWYNRVRRPTFDLETLDDPFVRRMLTHCRGRKRSLSVLDVTNDLGLPVAIAVSSNLADGGSIMFGLGAHFDAGIAVSRALAELSQCEALEILPEFDKTADAAAAPSSDIVNWLRNHSLESDPYCAPEGRISAQAYPRPVFQDLKQAVEACVRAVSDRGHEMIVFDKSRPEIDFSTARVVVPGLRHFWARFREGRLYQAPVDLGWLAKPRTEDELNPVPFFL